MRRTLVAASLLSTAFALLIARPSHAQFYDSGEVSIAIERAFGIQYSNVEVDDGPWEIDISGTSIGLGWQGGWQDGSLLTPLHAARLALDVFVADQLSVGGALGFFTHTGEVDDVEGLLFAPRVGYAIPLSRAFTFWPRGGFSYWNVDDNSLLAVTGEAMFLASPRPGWGILFGLTVDVGITGEAGNSDRSEQAIGVPVGILGTF